VLIPVPTAVKTPLPKATPFADAGRMLALHVAASALRYAKLLWMLFDPTVTRELPFEAIAFNCEGAKGIVPDQVVPSVLESELPKSPTATKRLPLCATAEKGAELFVPTKAVVKAEPPAVPCSRIL